MPSWQEEYLDALLERDKAERAQEPILKHYTKLADKTAALRNASEAAEQSEVSPPEGAQSSPRQCPIRPSSKDGKPSSAKPPPPSSAVPPSETLASVRRDLGEAQRSRGVMEARLQSITEDTQKLKLQSSVDKKQIRELAKEKAALATGLRDRNEELKGKAKLLEDVHDETVSLTLELNMAGERCNKLEKENKELVDRWMRKMAQEADAMNDKSKFS